MKDAEYVKRVKTELWAAQKVYDQAQSDYISAREAYQKAERAMNAARVQVDICKSMLIAAFEK